MAQVTLLTMSNGRLPFVDVLGLYSLNEIKLSQWLSQDNNNRPLYTWSLKLLLLSRPITPLRYFRTLYITVDAYDKRLVTCFARDGSYPTYGMRTAL